ncbi:hypothetical protein LTR85_010294 [Meristemomyces frigidus]|nr:hypothetical protein LTR85_010294 [Meristemomyces frigidus]
MSTATSSALPPGYHAPLAVADANHHGSWIVICNAFGLIVALICLAIRVYIRTKVSPPFLRDDHALSAATGLAVVQSGLVFAQVHAGFGRSLRLINAASLLKVQKLGYTADIFYILALYASKCCVVLLYKRISPDRNHSMVAWSVLSACVTLGVISVFLVALRCDLSHPWLQYHVQCSSLSAQWAAVAAFDILTEIAIFGMSLQLVWKLQTSLARKSRVVLAFGLRLPVIALAALRLYYIDQEVSAANPTLVGAVPALLTQLEIFYSIMSATIPCLRPFLAGFITNYGAMGGDTVMGGSQIGTSSKRDAKGSKGSFAMTSLSSGPEKSAASAKHGKSATRSANREMNEDMFRPNRQTNQTSVTHGSARAHDASSIGSNDSTKMIIKKDVTYEVHEGRRGDTWFDQQRKKQRELRTLYAAHQRHGAIVRLGPKEVSIASPEGFRQVYTAGLEKDPWYVEEFTNYDTPNLVSMLDHHSHSKQKRMISSVYAKSYLQHSSEMETLSSCIALERFLPLLADAEMTARPVNVLTLAQWAGMDFMTAYLFGISNGTNFLQNVEAREKYFGRSAQLLNIQEGALKAYREQVCMSMCEAAAADIRGDSKSSRQAATAGVRDDPEGSRSSEPVVFRKLYTQLLDGTNKGEGAASMTTMKQYASEMLDHILASHETTGIAVTYILWRLSQDPGLQQSLRNELSTLQPPILSNQDETHRDLPSPHDIDSLPLLNAIVHETLRLHAPAPSRQPRVVPAGGITIHGYFIPEGTTISSNAYTLHRHAETFPEPLAWKPQRWLADNDTPAAKPTVPAGTDAMRRWMCIGSNFATQIIKLMIAAIYTNYTTTVIDDEGIEQSDSYISGPVGNRLVLRFCRVE